MGVWKPPSSLILRLIEQLAKSSDHLLYHVTRGSRIPSIRKYGLQAGKEAEMDASDDRVCRNRIYCTGNASMANDWPDWSNDPDKDWCLVIFRSDAKRFMDPIFYTKEGKPRRQFQRDVDSGFDSQYITESVPPEQIVGIRRIRN